MKKKLISFILAICLIFPFGAMLTACKSNPPEGPAHTHNWSTNETEHWYKCDGCDEKKDKANHTLNNGVCSVCNYNPTHTHEYGNSYLNDSNYHWQKCEHCNNTTERENHNYIGNLSPPFVKSFTQSNLHTVKGSQNYSLSGQMEGNPLHPLYKI